MSGADGQPGLYRYQYGGVGLVSTVALDHLPAGGAVDAYASIRVEAEAEADTGRQTEEVTPLFNWPGRLGLSLSRREDGWLFDSRPGVSFAVDAMGTVIQRVDGVGAWGEDAVEMLVHRVLPRVVQLHGMHVLHGAVVARDGKAVLLCATSGSGKSTLAAYLAHCRGWSLMGDDACALRFVKDAPTVFATYTGLSLFKDSADEVRIPRSGRARTVARGLKEICEPAETRDQPAAEVVSIYIVSPTPSEAIGKLVEAAVLSPIESVVCLRPHLIRFNPADPQACRDQLLFLSRLAGRVPVRTLTYPRRFEALPEVADAIEAALSYGGRGAR